jgi:DNA-binding XRE family transcriptional regulator
MNANALELRLRELEAENDRLRGLISDAIEQVRSDAPREHVITTLRTGLGDRAYWPREQILRAARDWYERYGESPSDTAWSRTALEKRGRLDELEGLSSGRWPTTSTVRRQFGGFPAMLRQAGLEPNDPLHRGPKRQEHTDRLPEWTGWQLLSGFREQRAYSQAALAERSRVSVAAIREIEHGRNGNPGIRTVIALARGLGVPATALMD